MGNLSNEEMVKRYKALKEKEKRYAVKQALILKKAHIAGITVTETEIDAYLKSKK